MHNKLSCRREAARCFVSLKCCYVTQECSRSFDVCMVLLAFHCIPKHVSISSVTDRPIQRRYIVVTFTSRLVKVSESLKMVLFESLGTVSYSSAVSTQHTNVTPRDGIYRPRMRFGPRHKSCCADVSVSGFLISWTTSSRYLGVYLEALLSLNALLLRTKLAFIKPSTAFLH